MRSSGDDNKTPPPGKPVVRPARAAEVPRLMEFIHPFIEQKKILPRTEAELDSLADNGFVAELDGRLVGFAALEIYSSKLAEIRSLAVADEVRGRGVGRELVAACVKRACERNILEVMAISSAESFFRSCGFDFTLPDEKKAFFLHTGHAEGEEEKPTGNPPP